MIARAQPGNLKFTRGSVLRDLHTELMFEANGEEQFSSILLGGRSGTVRVDTMLCFATYGALWCFVGSSIGLVAITR